MVSEMHIDVSKGKMLLQLRPKVIQSVVPKLFLLSIEEWKRDQN